MDLRFVAQFWARTKNMRFVWRRDNSQCANVFGVSLRRSLDINTDCTSTRDNYPQRLFPGSINVFGGRQLL